MGQAACGGYAPGRAEWFECIECPYQTNSPKSSTAHTNETGHEMAETNDHFEEGEVV